MLTQYFIISAGEKNCVQILISMYNILLYSVHIEGTKIFFYWFCNTINSLKVYRYYWVASGSLIASYFYIGKTISLCGSSV